MRVEIPRLTNVQEELPIQFGLEQNYPNPFNPTTEIRYSIASGRDLGRSADGQTSEVSHVTLKVYDMLGREVTTLVNETKEPGYYSVRWNASGIASGVYYYWLRAGEYMATKQLVLLK